MGEPTHSLGPADLGHHLQVSKRGYHQSVRHREQQVYFPGHGVPQNILRVLERNTLHKTNKTSWSCWGGWSWRRQTCCHKRGVGQDVQEDARHVRS